jgi:signal transduction histidine kinase/ligand-binding sensor domain-containing protein
MVDRHGITCREGGRLTKYPLPFKAADMAGQVSLYEDRTGSLWISDLSRLYHLQNGQLTRYGEKDGLPSEPPGRDAAQIATTTIRGFCEDRDGGLWFILGWHRRNDNRLALMKDGHVTVFSPETDVPLTDIGQIAVDQEGTVWVGTAAGLFRVRKQIITAYSTAQGLAGKEVYPILQRRNGDMLVGTTDVVSLFHQGHFSTIITTGIPRVGLGASQALWEDANNNIWLGAIGGLARYENGKLKEKLLSGLGDLVVTAIVPDQAGNLWVGATFGLYKLENNRLVKHYTIADGLPNNDIKVIRETRDGVLWLGTYGGLARLKDGQFTNWTTRDGLPSDRIRALYEDAEGVLWIGTYDSGLSRFQNGKFVNYGVETGLFNSGVFTILEDLRSNFWISCNRGIYRVNRNELNEFAAGQRTRINSIAYDKSDGMLNVECNGGRQPAAVIARDGKFWFGTQDGVVVVDPEAIPSNTLVPPVEIEAVSIDRAPIKMDELQSGAAITINPGQTSLDISYTALSLTKSDLIRFRYKLEGLSNDWEEAGTRRTAYFSYLPSGEYTFHVIAANADGVWNDIGKKLKITVVPPVYRRWWFLLLAAGTSLGLFVLGYKYRVKQLERERDLQQEYARRLVNAHEGERKRIAGELHDGLSQSLVIIRQRATICLQSQDNPTRQHEQMEAIAEAATAVIDEVHGIVYDLRPVQLDLLGLTNSLHELLNKIGRTHHLQITQELAELAEQLPPETENNLYRIVQEALNNIVRHAHASHVSVNLQHDPEALRLIIEDDGCGFTAETSHDLKGSTGLGLTSMRERARVLQGDLLIESTPQKGTTITLRVPLP